MKALLAEAVTYFHSNAGFDRLFRLMRSKYRSYGRIGGRLELAQVTAAEAEALASLFGYNRYRGDVFSVLFKDVQPALDRTRFSGVVLEDLLAAYFRLPLRSRTEEQVLWEEERRVFFAALLAGVAGAEALLTGILARDRRLQYFDRVYRAASGRDSLRQFALAWAGLPDRPEPISIFASRALGDPHALDKGTDLFQLFITAGMYLYTVDAAFSGSELVNEVFFRLRLVRDDIANDVACYGLRLEDGRTAAYWQGAYDTCAVLKVPVKELIRLEEHAVFTAREVFVVENYGVFSYLADTLATNGKRVPLVCTAGQPRLATWLLLDRLVKGGATLYYGGDFDPEGLTMADKYLVRYAGSAQAWHMSPEDYGRTAPKVPIPSSRLRQLSNLRSADLQQTAACINERQQAGYQEELLDVLRADLLAVPG